MNSLTLFLKRYALVIFFVLAYALAWGSFYLFGGPAIFAITTFVAALIMAAVSSGLGGLKDLARRCLRWRVGVQWYAAALLVPLAIALTTVALNVLFGAPMPTAAQLGPWYMLITLFPIALVDAPLWEEASWRGFALPRFPANRSPLVNSLILGVLLAGWHLPIALSEPGLTVPYLIGAVASAVLTNWIYYNTRGSAFMAMLYHGAANAAGGFYFFQMFSGADFVRLWWLLAAVNGVAAVVVVLATGPNLRRRQATDAEVVYADYAPKVS
jgi:membrane protease YdiL (CAAX protease family)